MSRYSQFGDPATDNKKVALSSNRGIFALPPTSREFMSTDPDGSAAILLSMFSEDRINEIASFASRFGSGTAAAAHEKAAKYSTAGLTPLAFLSRTYIADSDLPRLVTGISGMLISDLRRTNKGVDEYERVLKNLFLLPQSMVNTIVKKINTDDILGTVNADGTIDVDIWDTMFDWVKKVINQVPGADALGYEIDQTNKYDIDFLYEVSKLGEVIEELCTRLRLMRGQTLLATGPGLFQTGDLLNSGMMGDLDSLTAAEAGPEVSAILAGDIVSNVTARNLPPHLFGRSGDLAKMTTHAAGRRTKRFLQAAGKAVAETGDIDAKESSAAQKQASSIDTVKKRNPNLLKNIALGVGGVSLIPILASLVANATRATADRGIMGLLPDSFRPGALAGDIDDFAGAVGDLMFENHTTGDPQLDSEIEAAYANSGLDEANGDPEMGGLFSRMKANMAKKKAVRVGKGVARKQARADSRSADNQAAYDARMRTNYARQSFNPRRLDTTRDYYPPQETNYPDDYYAQADPYSADAGYNPYMEGQDGGQGIAFGGGYF